MSIPTAAPLPTLSNDVVIASGSVSATSRKRKPADPAARKAAAAKRSATQATAQPAAALQQRGGAVQSTSGDDFDWTLPANEALDAALAALPAQEAAPPSDALAVDPVRLQLERLAPLVPFSVTYVPGDWDLTLKAYCEEPTSYDWARRFQVILQCFCLAGMRHYAAEYVRKFVLKCRDDKRRKLLDKLGHNLREKRALCAIDGAGSIKFAYDPSIFEFTVRSDKYAM